MKKPNVSFQFPIPTHRFPQGPIFGAKKFSQFAITNVSFQFPIPTHRFPQGPIFGAKKFSQFVINLF